MSNYFCGWYYRCQSDHQTLAIIPSLHRTSDSGECSIQIITEQESFLILFPRSAFRHTGDTIQIDSNEFSRYHITLDLNTLTHKVHGTLHFRNLTPIGYDIMGPFRYVPFLQCRHSVFSMRHLVNGEIRINDTAYIFHNGTGYMEGDRGHSFPKRYLWTQCSFENGSLMLSIADIPFMGLSFTGIIGIVLVDGIQYRLATYLGAKLEKAGADEIIVRQGKYRFILYPGTHSGHPLRAPEKGAMTRTIYEHPSCPMEYLFKKDDRIILALCTSNAAFEAEK